MTTEPDISSVLKYLFARAKDHEERSQALFDEAQKAAEEAKGFMRLATEMAAKFPDAKFGEESNGQILPNLSMVTFESLQNHLSKKAGRVKHVAKRLNVSERLVRDLITTPNSKFFIAERGWIKPKAAKETHAVS